MQKFEGHLYHCSNCGCDLTTENIRLALEDCGEGIEQESLTLCCPTYSDEMGCQGYSAKEYRELPAYWYTR